MARKIVMTSGKGGVGKTTVCANLGINLAKLGFRVVIIDVDIGLNNIDVVMGIENQIVFDLSDVLMGKCRAKQALVQDKNISSLYFLPSLRGENQNKILPEHIRNVLSMLEGSFDYILIDCPAGVDNGFERAVYSADEALIVVTPHLSSIRDASKVIGLLDKYNITYKGLIINRMRGDLLLDGQLLNIESIVKALGLPLVGVIPEDDAIGCSCSVGSRMQSIESARAFTLLCENIHNGSKKIFDCTYKYRGLMGYIRRNLKKRV